MKICAKCVLDNTVPEIIYDEKGVCNYCKIHQELIDIYPLGKEGEEIMNQLSQKIKIKSRSNKYDCIVGVSGGTDSTYLLYYVVKILKLKPLAVHFDNGWNSDIAVKNIKNATNKLGVDLYTHVANWEEFKDLQISFLKASTPDAEVPTDFVIFSVLYNLAKKEKVKYIIEGHSFRAEGTTPIGWTYLDARYIKNVQRKFGSKRIKSFPIISLFKLLNYTFIKKIKTVRPLEYLDYSKPKAQELIKRELGWQDPGGHHHESIYTKFFQSYYLPEKFNIDKRKRELSAKIRSGILTRQEALSELKVNYPVEKGIVDYVIKKLGISEEEFKLIMNSKVKSFVDYNTYFSLIQFFRYPIKIACKLHLFPPIVYLKYGINHTKKIQEYWSAYNKK
ncbi:N-acetyl sugar amidotransferase [Polaribacter aquimarinus]|uniref:N-acetyl sugar amidotransferase n=1 Tax=Polaribacter aquimarinus TaxID=2100726 RepID=A0A2U2JB07_9FLAO|nr:N-acetyl sugar amidotransferase [Polaribacter aquimarinus]PWG05526.1 N-acetyl sugar amidotransferase [Polaribacter aquimarinus]